MNPQPNSQRLGDWAAQWVKTKPAKARYPLKREPKEAKKA
jgi:hypothetical protein